MTNHVTPKVKSLIGQKSTMPAWDAVEKGSIRRFVQAIMDPDPIYWDEEKAAQTRYGGVVSPPIYPLYSFRFPPNIPDVLDEAKEDPKCHGGSFMPRFGLPEAPLPLKRALNGGSEIEFLALAKPGDRLVAESCIEDISQKEGRSGPLVFIRMNVVVKNQDGQALLNSKITSIRR